MSAELAERRAVCRDLGVTAWAVLEELAASAVQDGDHLLATRSVRRVAAELGLSKDTVARAVRALRDAGMVVRRPPAKGADGRFVRGAYDVRAVVATSRPSGTEERGTSRRRRRPGVADVVVGGQQGFLFEDAGGTL